MRDNFDAALERVLRHEGGYVNHPRDPGGATNRGITQRTYSAWLRARNWPDESVRDISDDEVAEIYLAEYWHKVRGDDLPGGLDYAVFDFAVNSGPRRAAQFLQRIVGVSADGAIGPQTLAAIRDMRVNDIITTLCGNRLTWLKGLKTWPTFGRGWERRVVEVERDALSPTFRPSLGRPTRPVAKVGFWQSLISAIKRIFT